MGDRWGHGLSRSFAALTGEVKRFMLLPVNESISVPGIPSGIHSVALASPYGASTFDLVNA